MVWQVILLCALVGITGSVAEARRPNLPVRYYDKVNDGPDWDMSERMEYGDGDRNQHQYADFRYLTEMKVKQENKGMYVKMDQKVTESKKVHIKTDHMAAYAPLYRFKRTYGSGSIDSYYTTDSSKVCKEGENPIWDFIKIECILAMASVNGTMLSPLRRYWNKKHKDSLYTIDPIKTETNTAQSGYADRGITGYCSRDPQPGTLIPLYRYWSSGYKNHLYTIDENDPEVARTVANNQQSDQYTFEKIACYVYKYSKTI